MSHFLFAKFIKPGATSVHLQDNCSISTVVSSSLDAEHDTLLINGNTAIAILQTVAEVTYLQGSSRRITDRATFWRLQRRADFMDFDIVWDAGSSISLLIADFFLIHAKLNTLVLFPLVSVVLPSGVPHIQAPPLTEVT